MQNRASCHCGRYILRRHAIRSFRYAFANARIGRRARGKKKEKKERRRKGGKKNGRGAVIGEGEGDGVEKVRGIFIRGIRTIRVECDARTHACTYVPRHHCHDIACAGACKKDAHNYARTSERTRGSLSSRVNATRRCVALIDTTPARRRLLLTLRLKQSIRSW